MKRRRFLKNVTTAPVLNTLARWGGVGEARHPKAGEIPKGKYRPGRIPNEYNLFLPGEREVLKNSPRVSAIDTTDLTVRLQTEQKTLRVGESVDGWQLLAVIPYLNGTPTAVFEKHVTHQGAISYVTERGEIAHIPKRVGDLSRIRPRPTNTPHGIKFERPAKYVPGPDVLGEYILNSSEDPCYENVAALGPEFIGWTLVANEECGPDQSLWLEANGRSRQLTPDSKAAEQPDRLGRLFEPERFLPSEYLYNYVPGYSKRTLLGGYLPAADIGVWNPRYQLGYEVMVIMPSRGGTKPMARIRAMTPPEPQDDGKPARPAFMESYWNCTAESFFSTLVGVWNKWHDFFERGMQVEIPDEWLVDTARAGVALCRCSFKGLEPSYQIGEGIYTHIPECFPMSFFEFVWAHQIWNLTDEVESYFQYYLDHFILPDGNFLFNTQHQVAAVMNTGAFLENSARAYDYSHDLAALRKRLPALRKMIDYMISRYHYSKQMFPSQDPRHGLIWGSPDADMAMPPDDDYPEAHLYYYQSASWIWRGLHEHARCLDRAGREHHDADLKSEWKIIAQLAAGLRADIERSLQKTLADRNPAMKVAGISPFSAFDTTRKPTELTEKENNHFMTDWWTSDWGDAELDAGHFRHRAIAGQQILGNGTRGNYCRAANFLDYGTLAALIRQDDYRPFLLALYGNLCYTMDSGNRYSPEDAWIPGSYPGEGTPLGWAAVVNSELEGTMGLRWMLCHEEHDRTIVHLQKAAPAHWFEPGQVIRVEKCPTRFGLIGWKTEAIGRSQGRPRWRVNLQLPPSFAADVVLHIHTPDRSPLQSASSGQVQTDRVLLPASLLADKISVDIDIT